MPPRTRTPEPEGATAPRNAPPAVLRPGDAAGWYRNVGGSTLMILAEGVTVALEPGRIAFLPPGCGHRDLAAATEAEFQAQTESTATAPTHDEPEA